jgi:hypothetical protein
MKLPHSHLVAILLLTLACSACGRQLHSDQPARRAPPVQQTEGERADSRELEGAAERIIRFLQRSAELDTLLVADTVSLFLAMEGGGASVRRSRQELPDRGSWRIPTGNLSVFHILLPPAANSELTTRVGTHFNCLESSLVDRRPEVAHLPHVGTRLMPPAPGSCLQAWNLTLVFEDRPGPPVLSAVVYDQWEW